MLSRLQPEESPFLYYEMDSTGYTEKDNNSLKENTATNSKAMDHYCRYKRSLQISNKNTNNQTKTRQQPSRAVTSRVDSLYKYPWVWADRQCSASLVILEMQIKNRKAAWHLPSKYFRSEAGPCSLGYSCKDAISRLVRPGPSGKHRLSYEVILWPAFMTTWQWWWGAGGWIFGFSWEIRWTSTICTTDFQSYSPWSGF